jgi:hypothetical protein
MRWLRTVRGRESARQAEPSTLVLNEPSCYHFRVLDPLRATDDCCTVGRGAV